VEHPFTPKLLHEVGRDEKSGKKDEKARKKDGGSLRITTLSAPQMTDVNPNGCGELDHPKEFLPLS
jgi:hypothetical protein